jgi:hypothetical protein
MNSYYEGVNKVFRKNCNKRQERVRSHKLYNLIYALPFSVKIFIQ